MDQHLEWEFSCSLCILAEDKRYQVPKNLSSESPLPAGLHHTGSVTPVLHLLSKSEPVREKKGTSALEGVREYSLPKLNQREGGSQRIILGGEEGSKGGEEGRGGREGRKGSWEGRKGM